VWLTSFHMVLRGLEFLAKHAESRRPSSRPMQVSFSVQRSYGCYLSYRNIRLVEGPKLYGIYEASGSPLGVFHGLHKVCCDALRSDALRSDALRSDARSDASRGVAFRFDVQQRGAN
jgi:hypothetical protein